MHCYQHLAILVIGVSAIGLSACSSSNNSGDGNMGGGGATSTSTGGAGGTGGTTAGTGGTTTGTGGTATGTGGSSGSTTAKCHAAGTLAVTNQGITAYLIDGAANPNLTFCRGNTYTFAINASGHPFYIKTVQGSGTANAYTTGVTGNGTETGNVTFVVNASAPSMLFYNCEFHPAMTGMIDIVD